MFRAEVLKRRLVQLLRRVKTRLLFVTKRLWTRLNRRLHRHYKQLLHWYKNLKPKYRYGVAATGVMLVAVAVIGLYVQVRAAPDLSDNWNFSNPNNYVMSNGLETSGSSVRLKSIELPSDANTNALYHFNETSGNVAADASGNNNTLTSNTPSPWGSGFNGGGLALSGSNVLTAPNSTSLALGASQSIEAMTKFGSAFNSSSTSDQYVVDKGDYKLYFDHTTGKLTYRLAPGGGFSFSSAGNAPWASYEATNTSQNVVNQIAYGTYIYYFLNPSVASYTSYNYGKIYQYNSSTGQTARISTSSIASTNQINITSATANGTTLYVGATDETSPAQSHVYSCDMSAGCPSWTNIGSFATAYAGYGVVSLYYQNGHLFAGTNAGGSGGADATKLFVYNSGTSWTQIGGTGSSPANWVSLNYNMGVTTITGDGTNNLYVAVVNSSISSSTVIWQCVLSGTSCSSWTAISSTLTSSTPQMTYFGGYLYAATDTTLQRYSGSGTTWATLSLPSGQASWHAGDQLTNDGTNLYIGVGSSNKIYKCSSPSTACAWTDISTATGIAYNGYIKNLMYSGGNLYGVYASALYGDILPAKYNGSTWQAIPTPTTYWLTNFSSLQSVVSYNGALYASVGHNSAEAEIGTAVYKSTDNGATWSEVGGSGSNGSWTLLDGRYTNSVLAVYNGNLYAGLSGTVGDGDVYRWNGTSWTKVGGDAIGGSWSALLSSGISSMTVYNGQLYVGIGSASNNARVYKYDGTTWAAAITGPTAAYPYAMTVSGGLLYTAFGGSVSSAGQVVTYDGTISTIVGGNSTIGNWGTANVVSALGVYEGKIYAAIGNSIYKYSGSGTSWLSVGGVSGSGYNGISSFAVYDGKLMASVVTSYGYSGAIWGYNGTSWSQISTLPMYSANIYTLNNMLWTSSFGYDNVGDFPDYYDALYKATTNDYILQSTNASWDTNWHKVAASYDGTTMKLYVDGTLNASMAAATTVPNGGTDLLIGGSFSGMSNADGYFNGTVDDVRLSNTPRAKFPYYTYSSSPQTISLKAAARTSGVWHWDGWADDPVLNGGTITYRLSTDGGTTWQWWNGSVWTTSSSTSQANNTATVNSNINTFPTTFGGITWQAILSGDGSQQVTLNSVSLTSTSDTTAPSTNATNIQAKKAAGDGSYNLTSNGWTNGASPYFSWTDGTDSQSGILGYCIYLGQDNTADPITTKGMLGNSPVSSGNNCQFVVGTNHIDLGTGGYLASPLMTSNTPYYLIIKAIDKAGNIVGTTAQFQFRFDNTPPANPTYITAPSGFVNNKQVTLTWPTSGVDMPADSNSGVVGLQYKINNSVWYGDNHSGTGDANDLLANDGSYTTISTPDFANLNEGVNTVYFRTWDAAGNVSVAPVTALIKLNTTGAPSEPLELQVTPTSNTTNSFAFTWSRPTSLIGDASNVTYCYVINNLPNASNCTYTIAGATSLAAGPYATQPGNNTLYLVARDESMNINYDNYASVVFSANTPAPGLPLNVDVADVSIKTTHNWRLAITWDTPIDAGAGIANYKVYRSTDNANYAQIGTSTSTSYIDTNLIQQTYYYRIVACDSANNCSANSNISSGYPTGKFTTPPTMTGEPVISNITTRHATVTWSTDRVSDSKIAIGTKSGVYDPPETLIADSVTDHHVDLNNLSAGTTYYIMARWTDEDGNTGHSQEVSFTTSPAPVIKEVKANHVGLSDATITFTSLGAYRVAIYYGISDNFGGITSLNTSASESSYSIDLTGLNDGTKYFFQPVAYDSDGNAYPGNIFSLTTPPRPRISNLRFQPVSGEPTSTQQITWTTNVPTDSTVTYGVVNSNGTDITKPAMTTDHSITISGLEDNSMYFLVARSRDASGNLAVSDRQEFRTALDTRPPMITNIQVETSIRGTGSQSRGQIIVSWTTDEPATSQVAYGTGTGLKVLNNKTAQDSALSTEHIVIVSDLPTSELYTVQPISSDKAGNQAVGNSQTAIIGRGSDDVLTIVLNSLKKLFGL